MNTLEQINELIILNKKPYLILKRKNGLNTVNQGFYNCDDCSKDDNIETKIEKSIAWLNHYVSLFPDDTIFYLYLKNTKESNQSGIVGPFEFSKNASKQTKDNNNGVNGIMPNFDNLRQLGYIPESEVKARLLEQELQFEREKHKRDIEELRNEFKNEIEVVKQTAVEWSPNAIKSIVSEIAPILGVLKGNPVQQQIAGVETQTIENTDIKVASINELAEMLYENASLKDIESLKQKILKTQQTTKEDE